MTALEDQLSKLLGDDPFARALGISFVRAEEGQVTLEMTITETHMNFLGGAHGGAIFALADMAFGLASNAAGTVSIGIDTHIAYIQGCRAGDVIRAEAVELSRARRTAVYRVDVTRDAENIATFTGTVYVTGRLLEEWKAPAGATNGAA